MSEHNRLSRRLLVTGALAAVTFGTGRRASAQQLAPTPACGEAATIDQGPGPFYKPRSPLRADLVEPRSKMRVFELSGQVLTRSCKPVGRALIDLWHSDDHGDYDNNGFRYRGHQFTDANGRYRFRTNMPEVYPGRTRHFHVKVQAANRPALNTQLYFPGEAGNSRDFLFKRELLMKVADAGDGLAGQFDFVLDLR
jgi:protocatechuate 3,4-dioxygenase beta subunit